MARLDLDARQATEPLQWPRTALEYALSTTYTCDSDWPADLIDRSRM